MATRIYRSGNQISIEQANYVANINIEDFSYYIVSITDTIHFRSASVNALYSDIISEVQDQAGVAIGDINAVIEYMTTITESSEAVVFDSLKQYANVQQMLADYPDVGGVIDLPKGVYQCISTDFKMDGYTINFTESIAIQGIKSGIHKISSSDNDIALITGTATLYVDNITFELTGTNSKLFDLEASTGFESVDIIDVQFSPNLNMGNAKGYRQGFGSTLFGRNITGLTLDGTWLTGFTIFDSRFIDCEYILSAGVDFVCASIRSNVNVDVPAGKFAFVFDYNNFNTDEALSLSDGRYQGDGAMVSPFTTGDTTDPWRSRKSFFKGNTGNIAQNTQPGGTIRLVTEATTILPDGVLTKLNGATVASDLEHMVSNADNTLTHNTSIKSCYFPFVNAVLNAPPNSVIELSIVKEQVGGGLVKVATQTRIADSNIGPNDFANFSINSPCFDLLENESVGLYATAIGASIVVTLQDDSLLYLKQ